MKKDFANILQLQSQLKKIFFFALQEFLTPPRILFWSFAWTAVISRMPRGTTARTYRPCSSFAPTFPAHSCRPGPIRSGVFAMKLQASKKGWNTSVRLAVISTSKAHRALLPCIFLLTVRKTLFCLKLYLYF